MDTKIAKTSTRAPKGTTKWGSERIRDNLENYSMLIPVLVWIFVFCYIPMYGVVIAFQNYAPGSPFIGPDVKWVGFKHFTKFISGKYFPRLIRNTLVLNGLHLLFGFTLPIIFAVLVNEVKNMKFKKTVQTASYLPYFISNVVVAGMVISFVDTGGLINQLLIALGGEAQNIRSDPDAFPALYTVTNVWKGFGFGSILYFSTLSAIDPALYESARIDGAGRIRQMWYITLPGLKNVIAIQLIMQVGSILSTNSDLILLLYNSATYETADVIGTYIYRLGIEGGQFSYTSAVGLFMSIIGFILTWLANKVSNKVADYGLW